MSMGAAKRGKPRIVSPLRISPPSPPADPSPAPPEKGTSIHAHTPLTPQIGPDTSIKDTWAKLATAIREIQNHNASKLSFEEHYRYAYNLVLFKRASYPLQPPTDTTQTATSCTAAYRLSSSNTSTGSLKKRSCPPSPAAAAHAVQASSAAAPKPSSGRQRATAF